MIIAPLVFATLVSAIARMGSLSDIGRIGIKTMAWFIGASCVSLTIGLLMAHWLQPGAALHATLASEQAPPAALDSAGPAGLSLTEFMTHLIPRSIVEAMADNEILQIVVFSIFVGTAAASLKTRALQFVGLIEQLADVMFKVTDYVMKLAPLAIFAALASSICIYGIGILGAYTRYVAGFYLSLGILWALLIAALAFATASSEAAYPSLLEQLAASGIPRRIASFVLPLGYSFNLDGAMMYCTFAILFIAQAYGVELTLAQQITLFGLLMVSTKGLAGVPRAAMAVIAVMLHYFHLPDSGIALILAVDHILDMGRSATNIVGNSVAAAVVTAWEGGIEPMPQADRS
jgi:Na+/H+-dicarboxylate symporter